jgi:hypothetical protein
MLLEKILEEDSSYEDSRITGCLQTDKHHLLNGNGSTGYHQHSSHQGYQGHQGHYHQHQYTGSVHVTNI